MFPAHHAFQMLMEMPGRKKPLPSATSDQLVYRAPVTHVTLGLMSFGFSIDEDATTVLDDGLRLGCPTQL
jgi:hypothetical protein